MELRLEKESLINILNAASIAGYSREANLKFSSEGLRIINVMEDQLLVKAWYSSSFFTEYNGDELEIRVDCKQLNRMSKFIDGETVRVEVKEDEFLIQSEYTTIYFSPSKEDDITLKLNKTLFGEVLSSYDITRLTDYIYAQTTIIPPGKLRPLGSIDELIFRVDNNVLSLVQQSEGVKFEKMISENVSDPSTTSVTMSSKLLIATMNVFKFWYKDVTIGIPKKENYPLIFHDSSEDYDVTVLVAPI